MTLRNVPIMVLAFVLGISSGGCSTHFPLLRIPQSEDDPVTLATTVNNHSCGNNWEYTFMIYVDHEGGCCEGRVPIQGTYHQQNDVVTFQPDFPFSAGMRYLVLVAASHAGHEESRSSTRVI